MIMKLNHPARIKHEMSFDGLMTSDGIIAYIKMILLMYCTVVS